MNIYNVEQWIVASGKGFITMVSLEFELTGCRKRLISASTYNKGLVACWVDITECPDNIIESNSNNTHNKKLNIPEIGTFSFTEFIVARDVCLRASASKTRSDLNIKKGIYDTHMKNIKNKYDALSKDQLIYLLQKTGFVLYGKQKNAWQEK